MNNELVVIGGVEEIAFPQLNLQKIHARIDTGAKTSSIWASNIEEKDGILSFTLFDVESDHYTGSKIVMKQYNKRMIASSNGIAQERYVVKLLLEIGGKRLRASFTLADRSSQVYPVLIGRSVLSGRFIVIVRLGKRLTTEEKRRSKELQANLGEE
ncbi:MAG: hypothetical protein JWP13_403 [Candidatus Saccharibacteria bacterium]|nr:hypothetical protein [Candidatus Saccharibacteria bacterium]